MHTLKYTWRSNMCSINCLWSYKVCILYIIVLIIGTEQTFASKVSVDFTKALLDKYGTEGLISRSQFQKLGTGLGVEHVYLSDNGDKDTLCGISVKENCTLNCLGYDDIFSAFSLNDHLNSSSLLQALPALVYSTQDDHCHRSEERPKQSKPTSAEAWGYSIGFASVVVVISNIGVVLGPCMKTRVFQSILMFCVALAVGTLAGTGLLVLIPESLGLGGEESPVPDYHLKMTTALGGVYVFFVVERLISFKVNVSKSKKKLGKENDDDEKPLSKLNSENHTHSHVHNVDGVSTVAWTLLIGDAVHNFSDGLAIGAGFTQNMVTGISITLAVLSEELPHELGDIAILLHSGLNIKKALFFNFLAAVMIYLGVIIGVVVGENTAANTYIFAFAGGLFVYIGLADMIPEMNVQAQRSVEVGGYSQIGVFVKQNVGLICGFCIIIILVNFGSCIHVS